jgi:hypothetical protein
MEAPEGLEEMKEYEDPEEAPDPIHCVDCRHYGSLRNSGGFGACLRITVEPEDADEQPAFIAGGDGALLVTPGFGCLAGEPVSEDDAAESPEDQEEAPLPEGGPDFAEAA